MKNSCRFLDQKAGNRSGPLTRVKEKASICHTQSRIKMLRYTSAKERAKELLQPQVEEQLLN